MARLTKIAATLSVLGTIALGSTTASQAADPAFAYTGDPAYAYSYGYAPGYDADYAWGTPAYAYGYEYSPGYAYSPGYESYAYAPGYRYRHYRGYAYNTETRSVPRHYDPGSGYNSNTVAPWQDWKYQGRDY